MMDFINSKNIIFASADLITTISQPLFNYSTITYFDFVRVYEDQRHICLTTSPEWNKEYYNNGFYIGKRHEYFSEEDISQYVMEDLEVPAACLRDIERLKMRKQFQHAHSLRIERVSNDYKDSYTFGTRLENFNINKYYLYNIEALNDFVDYFNIISTQIIAQAEKEKFSFPQIERELKILPNIKKEKGLFPKEFFQQIRLNKMPLKVDGEVIYLTKKEIECLGGFIRGKSAKEIARNQDISDRTVEQHLLNIKQKLGCWTKGEVIDKLFSNDFVRNYFFKHVV